jgi:O-antigen/teichoic acid export membrane protein
MIDFVQVRQPQRLLHRVMHAASWTMGGYFAAQALRFIGNLVLTRLLFPEAFGSMAIVQSILIGINMLSDIGVEQAIIQNKAGDDPRFVNTAWTLQVLRGGAVWIACCLLALPIASVYQNPEIAFLLPVIGFSAVIGGLASPNIALYNRRLGMAHVTLLEVGSSVVSLAFMVLIAWLTHSVWALVVGNLVGAAFRTICSHFWLEGIRNRFSLHIDNVRILFNFGSWIFVSTAITFLVGEGNRLIIGSFLNVRDLAFFSLAMTLALLPLQIIQHLGSRVLLPAYSEVIRERPEGFYKTVLKVRAIQIAPAILVTVVFIFFGQRLVSVLYDPRYAPVAPMLTLLALGIIPQAIITSYGPLLIAKGLVKNNTLLLAAQLAIQTVALTIGAFLSGVTGLLIGLSLSMWLLYPFYAVSYARLSLWQPKVDLFFGAIAVAITGLALYMQFR